MNAKFARVSRDKIPNEILEFARSMRKNPTEAESYLAKTARTKID